MRVDGVTEEKEQTWGDFEMKVLEILKDKHEIEDVTIERAQRAKSYQNNKCNKGEAAPRTIVCKLLNYKDNTHILQKCNPLKGASYYINENFSKETMALPKNLQKEKKTLRE